MLRVNSRYGGISELSAKSTGLDLSLTIDEPGNQASISLDMQGVQSLMRALEHHMNSHDSLYLAYLEAEEASYRASQEALWSELKGDPKY